MGDVGTSVSALGVVQSQTNALLQMVAKQKQDKYTPNVPCVANMLRV